MNKNYLILLLFVFTVNCSLPGSAFLGPAFTGATTKSVAQASLSFGTNQIVKQIQKNTQKTKDISSEIVKKIEDKDLINFHK